MSDRSINPFIDQDGDFSSNSRVDDGDEYIVGRFPKKYQRNFLDMVDKRFYTILFFSFAVHFITAFYFALNPPDTTIRRAEIDKIQKQFAKLVLNREIVEEPEVIEEHFPTEKITSKAKNKKKTGGAVKDGANEKKENEHSKEKREYVEGKTIEARKAVHSSENVKRRASRRQISKEVSSKGLLGLLTGSGSTAKGEKVADVLGEAATTQSNLDEVLGNLDGLQTAGKGSGGTGKGTRSIKGSRSTAGGGIDDLISKKEHVKSTTIKRKGKIVVEKVSAIADEHGIKSKSRDADKVSEVIASHNHAIQYCFQRSLKQNPGLRGKLVVRFTIMPSGKVKDVKVISSTLNNSRVERCIESRIRRWDDFGQIDPAKGDATFRQVYTFGY